MLSGYALSFGVVLVAAGRAGDIMGCGGPDLGWRLTFLMNVPIGVITIILGLMWFPRPLMSRISPTANGLSSLDPVGTILLSLAVLAILFPVVEARDNPSFWLLLPLGILLVWLWVQWEQRFARLGLSPMVNLQIFSIRSYRNGITISLVIMVAIFVSIKDLVSHD